MFFEYAKTAEEKGFKVIIAGAEWRLICRECAAIFPDAGYRNSYAQDFLWEEEIPFILSYRCRQESRLQQSLSTEAQTQELLAAKILLQHQMRNFW